MNPQAYYQMESWIRPCYYQNANQEACLFFLSLLIERTKEYKSEAQMKYADVLMTSKIQSFAAVTQARLVLMVPPPQSTRLYKICFCRFYVSWGHCSFTIVWKIGLCWGEHEISSSSTCSFVTCQIMSDLKSRQLIVTFVFDCPWWPWK